MEWLILRVFLLELQHWISPHSQLVAELVLGKIHPNVVPSGAPETLANHWLPAWAISPQVLHIYRRHWFHPPSVQRRRSCPLPYSSPKLSQLPGRKYSCVWPQQFLLPGKQHKLLRKPDDPVGSLHIEFLLSNLTLHGLGPFYRIWNMSVVLHRPPRGVQISDTCSTSGEPGHTAQLSRQQPILTSSGAPLNVRMQVLVWIRPSHPPMDILFIYPPRADAILSSAANANSPLPTTPLEVFSFSCGHAPHLVVWNVFIFNMFSARLRLSTPTSKLPLPVLPTVLGPAPADITLSTGKGENLAKHTSFKRFNNNESGEVRCLILRVRLGEAPFNSSAWRRHTCCIFFTGPALLHPSRSPTCVVNKPRG